MIIPNGALAVTGDLRINESTINAVPLFNALTMGLLNACYRVEGRIIMVVTQIDLAVASDLGTSQGGSTGGCGCELGGARSGPSSSAALLIIVLLLVGRSNRGLRLGMAGGNRRERV